MKKIKRSISENHARAPICAAFVQEMRAAFGAVTVLYVKENGHELVNTIKSSDYLPLPRSGQEAGTDERGNAKKKAEVTK